MSREIPLTKGAVALVDDGDYEWASQFSWHLHSEKYARRGERGRGTWLMHRELMAAPPGCFVDHVNRNGLDNRRCNLRLCSPLENSWNRVGSRDGYKLKGVFLTSEGNRWRAMIMVRGKRLNLGSHKSPEAAARAYDAAAAEHHGPFVRLNFPDGSTA